jgi:hypothetical protein
MPIFAANSAAFSHPEMRMVEQANRRSPKRNGGGRLRSSYGVLGRSKVAAKGLNFHSQDADENFVLACVCGSVSRLLLGHRFGACHAPVGGSLFCFHGFQKNLFVKNTENIFLNPP